ncbi:MAG: restriction endonuclease subunit S [Enterococcus faecalis]
MTTVKQKNVPALRFPEFPDDWEQRKLGEYVIIKSGWSPSSFELADRMGSLFIKVDDLNYSKRVQSDSTLKVNIHPKYKKIKKGSTLFPKRGAAIMTNKVRILGDDGYMDSNMMALEPNGIDSEFLYTFIDKTGLYKIADTSTIPQINNKHIEPYEISLPKLKEQIEIGSFFKQFDKTIALHQRKLDLLKEQKKGFLQKMFPKNGEKVPELRFKGFADDWEQRKLGEVFKYKQGQQVPVENQFENYAPNRHRFIRIVDITQKNEPIRYIDYNGENVIKNTDLFMIRYGQPGIVGHGYSGVIANNLFRLIPKINVETLFFYYIFENLYPKISSLSSSTTMPALSFKTLDVLSVKYPEIEEQQKIGSFFKQLDDTIDLHQRKVDLLKEQKKSFLQKMFV